MKLTKEIKKVPYGVLITIMLIISACLVLNTSCSLTAYAQSAQGKVAHLTEGMYEITNTDEPNDIKLNEYVGKYYGRNATLSWGSKKEITILNNDDIIKLIPEHLFKQVGIVQHIGREYGFFIETRKFSDRNTSLLSTVMIVNVTNANDMFSEESKSHLKIKIEPIFQGDFAYVERGNNVTFSLGQQEYDFYKEDYNADLNVNYPANGNGFVIPVPTTYVRPSGASIAFSQHNKYYITNASNQTSLYNVNQLNPYDDGYIAQNDRGCFFSKLDFTYDGFFLEKGSVNVGDVGSVAFSATSMAFDLYDATKGLKSVFKAVPIAGQVISVLDMFNTINNIGADLKDEKVSQDKKLTYVPNYNNKEQQIEAFGSLRKDEIIAIKGNSADNQLLFGTNNSFEFDYQIHCQDIKVDTRYASIINLGIVSVVSETANRTVTGQVHESTSIYTNELKNHTDKNYKEIPNLEIGGLRSDADMNILPNYNNMAQLSPKFSGKYNITQNNQYSRFEIYEVGIMSNGIPNYSDKSKSVCISQKVDGKAISTDIYLDKNKHYVLIADLQDNTVNDDIVGRYDIVKLEAELAKTSVIIGNNTHQHWFCR